MLLNAKTKAGEYAAGMKDGKRIKREGGTCETISPRSILRRKKLPSWPLKASYFSSERLQLDSATTTENFS